MGLSHPPNLSSWSPPPPLLLTRSRALSPLAVRGVCYLLLLLLANFSLPHPTPLMPPRSTFWDTQGGRKEVTGRDDNDNNDNNDDDDNDDDDV